MQRATLRHGPGWTIWTIRSVLLLAILCLLPISVAGAGASIDAGDKLRASGAAIQTLHEGWQMRKGDSPVDANGVPVWIRDDWQTAPQASIADASMLWYKIVLPERLEADSVLVLEDFYQVFAVYADQRLLYQRGEFNGRKQFYSDRWTMIALPAELADKPLYIRIYGMPYEQASIRFHPFVGARAEVIRAFIAEGWLLCVFALFFAFIALAGLLFFVFFPRNQAYGYLSLLAGCAALWVFSYTDISLLMIDAPIALHFIYYLVYHVMIVAAYGFFQALHTFGDRAERHLVWGRRAYYIVTAYAVVVNVELAEASAAYMLVMLLALAALVHVFAVIGYSALRSRLPEARMVFAASLVLVAIGMIDLYQVMFGVSFRWQMHLFRGQPLFPLGYLVFIGALAWILVRRIMDNQRQLKRYSQELAASTQALQKLDRLKDDFLANTSHELRTPLNGMIGIADSLLDGAGGPVTEPLQRNLRMIVNSGRRLLHLVNDILDFSQLKHQAMALQLKPMRLQEAVELALEVVKPLVGSKMLTLACEIAPDLPPVVADENRLQQILYNLLGNAIKFTESGSVVLSAVKHDGFAEIAVTDTGIGLAADQTDMIFQMFQQAGASISREYGGTGLGLSITKQLVELHGGQIWVKHTEGQRGATFCFTLPLAEQADLPPEYAGERTYVPAAAIASETAPVAWTAAEPDHGDTAAVISILVVDDEPVNVQVLINYLTLQHYEVTYAQSGAEALERLADGPKPDLVLLDLMMPKLTGLDVCRTIRRTYDVNELPIILLTAQNADKGVLQAFAAGANDYLTKPFAKEELLARVQTHARVAAASEEMRAIKEAVQVGAGHLRHAMKNDLGAIRLFSEKIQEFAVRSAAEGLIRDSGIIIKRSSHLMEMMKRVNVLTSDIELLPERGDAIKLVRTVLAAFEPLLAKLDIRLLLDESDPTPLLLDFDPVHMEEVIHNLVQNAMEAMPDGGELRVTAIRLPDADLLQFADTGEGIPSEHLPHVREMLYSTKSGEQHFGFGLHYCERVINKHGGSLHISSREGVGTTVTLRFARADEGREEQNEPTNSRASG
ncbi:response regulator [Paenibacillus athensensis]|uniref:ATP-binding protein n=1 Tax=Paenibacillus athensensis TaxID=1967502 RepID=UPI00142FAFB9|nr:ATP-binding protein [Paenibacillus athensensis]MCD1257710.1 response regulator [Paenibacillus athensensis]